MKRIIPLICIMIIACDKKDNTATTAAEITSTTLVSNLSFPWEIFWGPDNYIWMTERGGRISRVNPANGNVTPILNETDVVAEGEGGLLGMVLHPDFSTTASVFVAFNYRDAGIYKEKVVRYSYASGTLTSPFVIIDNIKAAGIHNGCRLAITADRKLLISTGDANDGSLPQSNTSINGKILRLNLDGSIPSDNPTSGSPVWTKGHRNVQGLVFVGDRLFSSEHGPDSDDEINIIERGRNYGWPGVKGFCDQPGESSFCAANNVKEPINAWTPTIAVSGMDYYNSDYIPQWKNSLLVATLKNSRLVQLQLNSAKTAFTSANDFFTSQYGRMRDVCVAPDGKVYICTSNGVGNDKIIVITKK